MRVIVSENNVTCPGDQVYEACGDACPRVCGQGLAEELECLQNEYQGCKAGCHCPFGLWLADDYRCVTDDECNQGTKIS